MGLFVSVRGALETDGTTARRNPDGVASLIVIEAMTNADRLRT